MLMLIIDDEQDARSYLSTVLRQVVPDAELMQADCYEQAMEVFRSHKVDVAFVDVEMPGVDGLTLIREISSLQPQTNMIVVTAYPRYARDALKLYVSGYLDKPVFPEDVRNALQHLRYQPEELSDKLEVRTFGRFTVSYHGEPVMFPRKRSLEFLAYLVARRGGPCSADEIVTTLWEEDTPTDSKAYLRVISHETRKALAAIGMENVLVHSNHLHMLDKELIECDLFKYLNGDKSVLKDWHGEFMHQYSWAEEYCARLDDRINREQENA